MSGAWPVSGRFGPQKEAKLKCWLVGGFYIISLYSTLIERHFEIKTRF
jgi:hypothetical protein